MPRYEYHCANCNKDFVADCKIVERRDPKKCPDCGEETTDICVSCAALHGVG